MKNDIIIGGIKNRIKLIKNAEITIGRKRSISREKWNNSNIGEWRD